MVPLKSENAARFNMIVLFALMIASVRTMCRTTPEPPEENRVNCYMYESSDPVLWQEDDQICDGDDEDDGEEEVEGHSVTKRSLGDFDDYMIQERPNRLHHRFNVLLNNSILFFEAQKSGKIFRSHQKLYWRTSSCLGDRGFKEEDLTGGWYDAGDNVKFNFPMAFSTAVLAWSLIEFPDAYREAGAYDDMLDTIKWTCDYFIKCHTRPNEYYYQVADANVDHSNWQRPEDIYYYRDPFRIQHNGTGSDVIGSTAAALATCAVAYSEAGMGGRATVYRKKAVDLYRVATNNIGKYPDNGYYINNNLGDELVWAATWLHIATGELQYLEDAEAYFAEYKLRGRSYCFGWGDTREGSKLLLYKITNKATYKDAFMNYMDTLLPFNSPHLYTPKGLFMRNEWGSLRYAAGATFVGLVGAKLGLRPKVYREFACNQTNYMLGDNIRRSFVIGYGVDPPCRPHHRASSCPDLDTPCTNQNSWNNPGCNHHQLVGAMVGGPDANDEWTDNRKDYIHNEVACDYNAVFQATIAGLAQADTERELPPACFILSRRVG
ncbi:endoglucanase F-like [Ptychodera flava]|uniref:endoglucanase F-like n=1 Tax=Ptychodera flava TaxID=63121 RepID=UPI00396A28E2